jgi:putative ABC transport system substrate-binding protein
MRRREFITLLGGAAAWPLAARAQPVGKLPTIGILAPSSLAATGRFWAAFVDRLRALGWIEGRTVTIEFGWADGRDERNAEIAAEFVRHRVNVIVTSGSAAVVAAEQATTVIPIVFAIAADPVGTGLATSVSRPGGNVTGMSGQLADTAAKRFGFLHEVVPGLRRLAILGNIGSPGATLEMREVETAARTLGLDTVPLQIQRVEDIAPALDSLNGNAEALYVAIDPLVNTQQIRINTLALSARLPTIFDSREMVATGGLMSYGPNRPDLYRRAAELVDKILRGEKPAQIPVEQPTKFELIINLTTAKAMRLTIPPTLLAIADEVIE